MYRSLQEYVDYLESRGELKRVKQFIDPVMGITRFTQVEREGKNKALLFENTGTPYPVLTNFFYSENRVLYALDINSFDDILSKINALTSAFPEEKGGYFDKFKLLSFINRANSWLPVSCKGHAPCQDVVQYGANLSELPILKCFESDGGRFITLPLVHTYSPVSGKRAVDIYPMQMLDDCSTSMHFEKHKDAARHLEESKYRLPVAVCLGGDPLYSILASTPLPPAIDKYLFAGFLRDKPVEMTDCFTQEIKVPADCDFVIEGYIQKTEAMALQGAFGDPDDFCSEPQMKPVFHITCISHRKEAIYPAFCGGRHPQVERHLSRAWEEIYLPLMQKTIAPSLLDLYMIETNIAVIKVKKRFAGQVFSIANALWGSNMMMLNKLIIAVDENVNIRDTESVKQALLKNYLPERDTLISKGPDDVFDHSAHENGRGGKLCIDATTHESGSGKSEFRDLIKVTRDHSENEAGDERILRLLSLNCDMERDVTFRNSSLILDARCKVKD
ncbi:MAG: UbiD family decarboxylase [Bacteroidales bacterium]|nr:UbiD family decarboxylase [Bacteroidales bacterium]